MGFISRWFMESPWTLRGGDISDSSSDLMSIEGGGIWVLRADIELMGVGRVIPDVCRVVRLLSGRLR